MNDSVSLRIDKWLCAARFFKTRSLAVAAITSGRIKLNGDAPKSSREVEAGDAIDIASGEQRWSVVVRGINAQRRPASEARLLYQETTESIERRKRDAEMRKFAPMPGANLRGRPTKKAGRLIRRVVG